MTTIVQQLTIGLGVLPVVACLVFLPNVREGLTCSGKYPAKSYRNANPFASLCHCAVDDDDPSAGYCGCRHQDAGGGRGRTLQPSALAASGVHRGVSGIWDGPNRVRNIVAEKTWQDALGVPFSQGEA